MNPVRVLALARRIVQQFLRDHRTLALIFVVPIVVLSLLGYLMRSQESQIVTLGISNRATAVGPLNAGNLLVDQLKQNAKLKVVDLPATDKDVKTAVRNGDVGAALIFPPSLTTDLIAGRPISLTMILEGSNPAKTGSTLPVVQGALLQAATKLASSRPGATPPPQLQINAETLYGSVDLKMLDYFAPILIGFFAFFLIFLLTCVSFLRERTQGTMERLSASPITRGEIAVGYMLGFGLFALIQSALIVLWTVFVLQVQYRGNLLWVFLITLLLALSAVNLGIFLSTFARTELQAVQFIPIVIVPQVLLGGLFWPVKDMPDWLQWIANVLPMTYANSALTDIMIRGHGLMDVIPQLLFLLGFVVVAVILAGATLRREVA